MRRLLVTCTALGVLAACSSGSGSTATAPATVAPLATSTTVADTTTSSTSTTSTTSTTTSTTSTTTTAAPSTTTTLVPDQLSERVIGTSVEGRPITAIERGTPGGTVVLVVGVIHGTEDAGLAIVADLKTAPLPPGIDLWLIDAINPDGVANQVRGNGNQVDLNRNFPHDWTQIAQLGDWQYSGTGPASEPETQAFIAFADEIQPRLTLWYHQDLFRLQPSTGLTGQLVERYASLTGLPILTVTGGTYTGVAATWVRRTIPSGISFIVELGPTLSSDEARTHAAAVLDIAQIVRDA